MSWDKAHEAWEEYMERETLHVFVGVEGDCKGRKCSVPFSNLDVFNKFFTFEKLLVLVGIKSFCPSSIKALSNRLGLTFDLTEGACIGLSSAGFITALERSPKLVFDYNWIRIHLPGDVNLSYNLREFVLEEGISHLP